MLEWPLKTISFSVVWQCFHFISYIVPYLNTAIIKVGYTNIIDTKNIVLLILGHKPVNTTQKQNRITPLPPMQARSPPGRNYGPDK